MEAGLPAWLMFGLGGLAGGCLLAAAVSIWALTTRPTVMRARPGAEQGGTRSKRILAWNQAETFSAA